MRERTARVLRVWVGVVFALAAATTGLSQDFGLTGKGGLAMPGKPAAEAGTPQVRVSGRLDRTTVRANDQIAVAVVLDHLPGWHTWPSAEQDVLPADVAEFAIRTSIEIEAADWIGTIGPVQWPEPHEVGVADPMGGPAIKVMTYSGRAVAYVPLVVGGSAPLGAHTLRVKVGYQSCDETMCMPPEDVTLEIPVEIVGAGGPDGQIDDETKALFAGFDSSVFERIAGRSTPTTNEDQTPEPSVDHAQSVPAPVGSTFFGLSLGFLHGPMGIALLLLLSALGGAILNLTPCVLPVIPIKVMTLTRHASSPGRSMYLGAWMAAGVIAFWVGVGLPAAFVGGILEDPSRIFGIWWVTFGLGVLIALMALGLMGLFTLTLPQKVYAVNPNAENAGGSFLFGVMTGVLGLPCFGFVAAALLGAAATFPPVVTLAVFAGIGVGMAAPYLVLAARPSLLKSVPKTGPASELVKQVMGFLLLAAAAYFIGSGLIGLVSQKPYLAKQLHWWAMAAFGVMGALWLLIRTFQITRKPVPRVVFGVLAVVIGALATYVATSFTATARSAYEERQRLLAEAGDAPILTTVWMEFTPELLARAHEAGYVVVLDFTAEWCLNCKALKATVLNRNPVKEALMADDVVMLSADLTSSRAPGWDFLRNDLGQTGIPLLVVFGPGLEEPWMSSAYTSSQVVAALDRARRSGLATKIP